MIPVLETKSYSHEIVLSEARLDLGKVSLARSNGDTTLGPFAGLSDVGYSKNLVE